MSFLTAKWEKEKNYKLRKELFAFTDNKIAVQFWYEVGTSFSIFLYVMSSGGIRYEDPGSSFTVPGCP